MNSADLLTWANTTDVVTIPAIQQDVVELQNMQSATSALLSAKVQEFGDTLDAHAVSLDVNFSASEVANTRSYYALSQLYDINLRINTEVTNVRNQLRAEIQTQFDARDVTFGVSVKNDIMGEVNASVGSALASVSVEVAGIQNVSDQVTLARTEILSAVDGVLDTTLPMLNSMQGVVQDQVNATDNFIAYHLAGFEQDTLIEGLDQIVTDTGAMVSGLRTEYEASLSASDAAIQAQIDAANGTIATHLSGFTDTNLLAGLDRVYSESGALVSGLRTEYEASLDTLEATLVQDYYTIVDANQAIVTATTNLQSTMESPGGSVHANTELTQSVQANLSANYLTTADIGLAISASNLVLNSTTYDAVQADLTANYYTAASTDQAISNASTVLGADIDEVSANLATNYYTKASTDGAIAASKLVLNTTTYDAVQANLDVNYLTATEVDLAIASESTTLNASIDGVSSNLSTNYYTKTATDSAISSATTSLQSSLESPAGSIGLIKADLTNNYYTIAGTDGAIAGSASTLQSSINGVSSNLATNYRTASLTDSAITAATAALKSSLESPTGSIGLTEANLSTNYYTIAATDSAVSASTLALKAGMEGSGGSVYNASAAAQTAYDLAGSKGKVMVQSTAPLVADRSDKNLWIDTTGGANTPKRWDGVAWVAVTDKAATDAASAAASALQHSQNVSADLASNYYTKVTADTAIAAATTSLKSSMEGIGGSVYENTALAQGIQADLTTNYLTTVGVNGAISSSATDISATIAGVNANLTNNYYTIVAADGAISAAITNLQSTMESPSGSVGTINSNLAANYYTKTASDSADSAATLALKSSMEGAGGSVFAATAAAQAASDLAGSKGKVLVQSTAPVAADRVAQNLWIDTTSEANTPKRWVSGTTWSAVTDKAALDAAAAALAAQTYAEGVSANLTTNYRTSTSTDSAIAASSLALKSSLEGTGGSIFDTMAFAVATQADLTTNYLTYTAVDQAIASFDMSLNASMGPLTAGISVNATAIVGINAKAASMYAIQATAGGAVGSFEVVAWDDIGGAGSAVKINADNILLEGTVSANKLAIGDFTNHVNDPNGRYLENWSFDTPVVNPTLWVSAGGSDPISSGISLTSVIGTAQEFMNTTQGYSVPTPANSIDVLPDDTYTVKAWVYKAPGSTPIDAYLGFRVTNYASNASAYAQITVSWTDAESGWKEVTGLITIPTLVNGVLSTMALVHGGISNTATLGGVQVVFGGMSIRKGSEAVTIADGTVTAPKIAAGAVTADKIQAGAITADKLNVTELSAISATVGILRTATSGARMEIHSDKIIVYDTNNLVRMRMGNLA